MSNLNSLPFPLDGTYFEGDSTRATSVGVESILGVEYVASDKGGGIGKGNGTNAPVVYKAVQNGSNGTLTLNKRKGVKFDTGSALTGRIVEGFVTTAGGYGLPVSDRYPTGTTFIDNEIFWVIAEGPVRLYTNSSKTHASAYTGGARVSFTANGLIQPAAVTDHTVGTIDRQLGTASNNTSVLVWTGRPYRING